jgi:rhodanese-related sulfurtransferase
MKITKRHIILAGLLFVAGVGLLLLPMQENSSEMPPEILLAELNDETRFYSTDLVAQMIIDKDPSFLLVDVRSAEEFDAFSLEGAINIPFAEVISQDALDLFSDDTRAIVLYSNDHTLAEQAWLLLRRKNYKHIHVMQGGLNRWVETILMPPAPGTSDPKEAHDLYSARLGARMYFTGVNPAGSTGTQAIGQEATTKERVIPVKRNRQSAIEGGC